MTQVEKGSVFRALHTREKAFIIPNPWDAGSARLLAHLGFEALATTSAGFAFSAGQRDSTIGRDATIAHVSTIASATDLPVNADVEAGFADEPEAVATNAALALETGVAGLSVEDRTGRALYEQPLAVDRIKAAHQTIARSGP